MKNNGSMPRPISFLRYCNFVCGSTRQSADTIEREREKQRERFINVYVRGAFFSACSAAAHWLATKINWEKSPGGQASKGGETKKKKRNGGKIRFGMREVSSSRANSANI